MNRHKEVWSVGICALVLALAVRIFSGAGLLSGDNTGLLSLLVYLQTGRVVRYPDEVILETLPATQPSAPQIDAFDGVSFTLADLEAVELNDLTGYDPDLESLLLSPLQWNLTDGQPRVLILHTHATESYTKQPGENYEEDSDYRTLNPAFNMLSIGDELTRVLTAGGISVLHDRTLHDYPSYSGSYDLARDTIRSYLEAFPSICMVIDLHRDALDFSKDPQLTTLADVGGNSSAQLMIVAGTDKNVSYENWEENLALGVKLTATLEKMYPDITRPLQLRAQRFNLDMTTGSILVEVGANGDSHRQALVAVRALGAAILVLSQGANLQNAPPP